jgi:cytochrome c553
MNRLQTWVAALAGLFVAALAPAMATAADDVELGRRIYQEGVTASGAPLQASRMSGLKVSGAEAACVRCHRPSGMGAVEGFLLVPPISGVYLFNQSQKARATMNPHVGKLLNQYHPPYTDETLALAIRTGQNNSGRMMSEVMPQYDLQPAEMQGLIAYLRQLTPQWSPGVTAQRVRLATVVAPGVDPERRKAFVATMQAAVGQKNGSTLQCKRHMVSPAEMLMCTERKWDLDIWELTGAPETWAGQLDAFYARQPVFALVSGLAAGPWQPVHDFCERQQVPCWFPSVDLPPTAGTGRWSMYFSRGVQLEAEVLAQHLRTAEVDKPGRVVQILRDDEVGRGAAQALTQAMAGSGLAVQNRALAADADGKALRQALQGLGARDAVVLWLRPSDVAALADTPPPAGAQLFFSGTLTRGGQGFAAGWKPQAQIVYPYELPEKRKLNLAYFHYWLQSRKLPLIDEVGQSETYFALTFLTDTMAEMLDNLYREYLLERAEDMINSREAGRAEEEARDRPNLGYRGPYAANRTSAATPGKNVPMAAPVPVGQSQSTTIYPRLTLGQGQRFASKGAYIVRFASPDSDALVAQTEWILP